jgi:hypothetical protein
MRIPNCVAAAFIVFLGACSSTSPNVAPPTASSASSASSSSSSPAAASTPAPPAPHETSASSLVDHLGDSTTTAVPVPAEAPEEGVPFENNWIFDRFGRFRKIGGGTGQEVGRRYDVVKFELPDHSEHTVYFDITENWQHWTPPR